MLDVVAQGIRIVFGYSGEWIILLLSGLGFGALAALFLFRSTTYDDRIIYILLLGFALIGLAAPTLALLHLLNRLAIGLIMLAGMTGFVLLVRQGAFAHWRKNDVQKNVWIPSGLFLLFLILRLGFLAELLLPPFSDSAEHYEKLSTLLSLEHAKPFTFDSLFPYYHWGFHGITAWADVITGDHNPLTLAVVAQFFLALLPVSVYFMLLAFTDADLYAALFGALLAGLGWVMPAQAVNFGKYPALAAICLLPLLLGAFHLTRKSGNARSPKWWLYLGIVALALIWIHSRLLVIVPLFFLTDVLSGLLVGQLPKPVLEKGLPILIALILVWVLLLANGRLGNLSFRYYLDESARITFLVLVLLPFAFRKAPRMLLPWSLTLAGLIVVTGAALPNGVYHYPLTLLDQIFFDLIVFLPLVTLGALGMHGARQLLPAKGPFFRELWGFAVFLILVNGIGIQPWTPLASANYVSQDDLRALTWIKNHTPLSAAFLIAALPKTQTYARPTDAGIWINVLTGRTTLRLPFQSTWDRLETVRQACAQVESHESLYLYVGHMDSSFRIPSCDRLPGLSPTLCLPQAKLFAVDCAAVPP